MPRVLLTGCTSEPMSAYLRALAVFRLVSEQVDSWAQGSWTARGLCLDSQLDGQQLIEFFLERYSPTPIVAPWNFGSGFYEGDKRDGANAIAGSESPRFRDYARTIAAIRSFPEMPSGEMTLARMCETVKGEAAAKSGKQKQDLLKLLTEIRAALEKLNDADTFLTLGVDAIKARKAKDLAKAAGKLRSAAKRIQKAGSKEQIVLACRNRLCDRAVDWIDSSVVLSSETRADWPPVAGTGGNEGRLDYTNSFMDRLARLLIDGDVNSAALLRNALFGQPVEGLEPGAIGQYEPGRAGGSNQGQGIESKDFPTNPWSFVLAMEGVVAWASGVGRRQSASSARRACSPFTVDARAVGYSSAADADEIGARAEIWMPLWTRPCGFEELRYMLREGRAEIGGKPATDGLQFAEAASSLGVDRGISSFARYSLLKRRGESYVALPAGNFAVQDRREVDLLRELEPALDELDRHKASKKDKAPAQFLRLRRGIDDAIFNVVVHGGAWQMKRLIAALGRMERYLGVLADKGLPRPIRSQISTNWLEKAYDGSLEFRVAAALASIGASGDVGPLRANLTPVDPKQPGKWANGTGQHAWSGVDLHARLAGVLRKRILDAERLSCKVNPLGARVSLSSDDIARFISGDVDQEEVECLLFGLTWIDWSKGPPDQGWDERNDGGPLPRSWVVLKWLFLPGPNEIRAEEAIVPLLCANRIAEACEVAQRRLRCEDMRPRQIGFENSDEPGYGVRLAASLLLPIGPERLKRIEFNSLFHEKKGEYV